MVKRIFAMGISVQCLLMDSWFTSPATVVTFAQHLNVIGMVEKSPNINCIFKGHSMDLKAI